MKSTYIKWPTTDEVKVVSEHFTFPYTIGAIDGSHIPIKQPLHQLDAYTNRKFTTSVILQAVCDSTMLFTDVSVGWSGSMHDARVFRLSHLGRKLENEGLHPYHLLGDSAYALKPYMIVPFRDNGHLSQDEKKFNLAHSASRCVVERAFARLKGKFRRLKYLDMDNKALISDIVTAACVLHNFILRHDSSSEAIGSTSTSGVNLPPLEPSLSAVARREQLMYVVI